MDLSIELIFSIPALLTCTPTEWCRRHCYACKGRFGFGAVKKSLEWKYKESQKNDFVERVNSELKRSKKNLVRVHAAGDFYSAEYINKWKAIAIANPDKKFRAYTKRVDLKKELETLNKIPNFDVYESIDETKPKQQMKKLLFGAIAGTPLPKGKKFRECNSGCEECGHLCWHKPMSVVFHKH
jgi:hypothetical protein